MYLYVNLKSSFVSRVLLFPGSVIDKIHWYGKCIFFTIVQIQEMFMQYLTFVDLFFFLWFSDTLIIHIENQCSFSFKYTRNIVDNVSFWFAFCNELCMELKFGIDVNYDFLTRWSSKGLSVRALFKACYEEQCKSTFYIAVEVILILFSIYIYSIDIYIYICFLI